MIKLSSTSEYNYCVIELPKESSDISLFNSMLSFKIEGGRDFIPDIQGELLGVIGGNEQISEEIAKEIVPYSLASEYSEDGLGKFHYHSHCEQHWFSKPSDCLKHILAEEGILIENPIEKPEERHYSRNWITEGHLQYEKDLTHWQSYESKLVKAVIIKVKK